MKACSFFLFFSAGTKSPAPKLKKRSHKNLALLLPKAKVWSTSTPRSVWCLIRWNAFRCRKGKQIDCWPRHSFRVSSIRWPSGLETAAVMNSVPLRSGPLPPSFEWVHPWEMGSCEAVIVSTIRWEEQGSRACGSLPWIRSLNRAPAEKQ